VPLFETLDDLNRAPTTMKTLLGNDWYRGHIKGLQECMIGGYRVLVCWCAFYYTMSGGWVSG
jgi:hypothetical protein